jgi:hypothetical protein
MTQEQRENVKKLIAALRSDKYQQGQDYLRAEDRFCCLGVAEDVRGCRWTHNSGNVFSIMEEPSNISALSKKGTRYYGFCSCVGNFDIDENMPHYNDILSVNNNVYVEKCDLVTLNDGKLSFSQIADVIEYCMNNPNTSMFVD